MEGLYLFRQAATIVMLFASGWSINLLLGMAADREQNKIDAFTGLLLAYPTGLAVWGVMGFLMLVISVPYGLGSIAAGYGLLYLILGIFAFKSRKLHIEAGPIAGVLTVIAVIMLAVLCCSGIIPVSMSNDSYYYYSLYPQTIVSKGAYLRSFDVFLTDVGQTTAVIGCLPWFFGFEETFGIQLFLGFNLIGIYGLAVSKYCQRKLMTKRLCSMTIPVVSVILLVTLTPFVVMTRWILANAYFMTYLFLLFVMTVELGEEIEKCSKRNMILLALYVAMLSMMRMEGGMMAGLLTLTAMGIPQISNKLLLWSYALPIAVTQAIYYATIYLRIKVDPLYSFLSTTNVFVMLGFAAAILIYICFFRKRAFMALIEKYYAQLFLLALVLGNALIAVISTKRYVKNIYFLISNVVLQYGWGFFAVMVLVALIWLPVPKDFLKKIDFADVFTIGFVLFAVALAWARDGSLRLGIGDSGNRVLLQIAPFVMYCLTQKVVNYIKGLENE